MTPVGSMSATRINFAPLLERLKMQLAQNQFGAQMQQQQQFHQGEMDLAGLKLNAQESQFTRSLAEQQAGREQQGALARAGQAFNERELAQRGALARAGQDLQRRGQDIGVREGAMERAARERMQERDIGSREGMQEKEQGFRREEGDKDRAMKQQELDWRKEVTQHQIENEDKRLDFELRGMELDEQLKRGEINQQRYRGELLKLNVESAAQALAEAKKDIGLSPQLWEIALDAFNKGEMPPAEIMEIIQQSPKAARALDTFYRAMSEVSGREYTQAKTEAQKLENEIVKGARGKDGQPAAAGASALSDDEKKDYAAVSRRVETGKYKWGTGGGVLALKAKAYALIEQLADKDDPDAQQRVAIARKLIKDADVVGDKPYTFLQANLPETPEEIDAETDPFDRALGAAGYLGID